jgi:hypothetical protein
VTTALLAGLALLIAALVPPALPHRVLVARGLGAAGVLGLLVSGGGAGGGPFVLLAAAAAVVATPLPLAVAAGGAALVALRPEATVAVASVTAGLAAAAAAAAVETSAPVQPAGRERPSRPVLGAGAVLVLLLASVGHGMLLGWSFVVDGEGVRGSLPGAGVALGFALLAGLAGLCLLAGATLVPEATAVRPVAVGALWVAFALGVVGEGIALVRALDLSPGSLGDGAPTLALLVAATGALGTVLVAHRHPVELPGAAGRAALATRVAAALAVASLVAAGVEGWWREGSYATGLTAAAGGAALLGLAALEPGRGATARRLALLAAVLVVALG